MKRLQETLVLAVVFSIALFALLAGIGLWGGAIVYATGISPWLWILAIVVPLGVLFAMIVTSDDGSDPK